MKKPVILFAILGVALGCSGSDDAASNIPANADPAMPSNMGSSANADSTPDAGAVSFASIQPAMQQKCIGCHGDKDPKDGLALTSYASLMKGGKEGPVVVPGDPENSKLVHALRGSHGVMRMPAKADPLPEETIAAVEAWIRAGAKE